MPLNTQTYSGLTAEQKTFYERTLLKRCLPNLLFYKYAQKKPMPKRDGDKINFRKFESLDPATTALTEGVTPSGNNLTISTLVATVAQYGDFIAVSDILDTEGIDPVITESSELCGEQAALTIDTLLRDAVCAGTNVQYANKKTGRDAVTAADVLTGADVKLAVRTLKRNNIKRINGFYIGLIDPDQSYDLQNDPLWQDVSKYNGGQKIMDGEVGKMHGVRFIETTNLKVVKNTGKTEVHCAVIFGQDAYGCVDIEGKSKPKIILKTAGSSGTEDPLEQRSTVGWKTLLTGVRLNEMAIVRLETGATV